MLFLPREEGQGLVEYALILVLVAIVVIVILALLGPSIANIFTNIISAIYANDCSQNASRPTLPNRASRVRGSVWYTGAVLLTVNGQPQNC